MKRFFNTTGLCIPQKHYMVPPFRGMDREIIRLIEAEQYFLLHAPRQTGKTTLLHAFARRLNEEGTYISLVFSVETAGVSSFTEEMANERMVDALYGMAEYFLPEEERPVPPLHPISLKEYIRRWCRAQTKPIILLIDEVDSLWDDVLVSMLRQLRDGFQARPKNFPQSIGLVGLRDIRDYKLKARAENRSLGSGSPFNVKAKSFFLPFFSREEVRHLLDEHTEDTGQEFSKEVFEEIFTYSSGQPWLTNALANEIVADMLQDDYSRDITPDMVETAKEALITQRQTHLDSLVDRVQEPRVRKVIGAIIEGDILAFDGSDDAIRYCRDLGLITQTNPIQFSNPIYREIVTRVLNLPMQESFPSDIVETTWYLSTKGRLEIDKLLEAFVAFYRRHSESWLERFDYKEAGHQLLLMAFLQRVINGGGRIEREMAVGNGRTDLAVYWKDQVIPIELKLHHDAYVREDGLRQLSRYMDKLGQTRGHLMIFEKRPSTELSWETRIRREEEIVEGREIQIWWM